MKKTSEKIKIRKEKNKRIDKIIFIAGIALTMLFLFIARPNNQKEKALKATAYHEFSQTENLKEHIAFLNRQVNKVKDKETKEAIYTYLGKINFSLGKYEKTLNAYDKAYQLNPQNLEACANIGSSLVHLQKYKQAIEYLEKAIQLNPNVAVIYDNLGVSFTNTGKIAKGIKSFQKAIRLNPEFYNAYLNIISAYFMLEDYPNVEYYIKQAIQNKALKSQYGEKINQQQNHLKKIKSQLQLF